MVRTATVLIAVVGLLVTPTVAASPAQAHPSGSDRAFTRTVPLPRPVWLEGTGRAWRMWYPSTSWDGRPTVVSGTLALPRGRAPAGGWPVVSFGPGFSGTPDRCAASRTGAPPFVRPMLEALLAAGYAIAVTDYEGIGTRGESPIVNGRSEAYSMIDIVRAARQVAPVSRSWVGLGYSLGGHAALFAGALTHSYAPDLRHLGTIAVASVTQWAIQFSAPVVRDPDAPINPTVPYTGRSLPLTHPGEFRAEDWFTQLGLDLVRLAGRICIEEMAASTAGLTNADVFSDVDGALDRYTDLFAQEEVPVQPYPRPIRLAHGTADAVPAVLSEITAGQLAGAGNDVSYLPVAGADHFTVLAATAPQVVAWTGELFQAPA